MASKIFVSYKNNSVLINIKLIKKYKFDIIFYKYLSLNASEILAIKVLLD